MSKLATLSMFVTVEKGEELTVNRSSLLHGIIMERISESYAAEMHKDGMKPYSQSLQKINDKVVWQVHSLTEEAYDQIIMPLYSDSFRSFELRHSGDIYNVSDKMVSEGTSEELIEQYYLGECERQIAVLFQTPAAFRQQGQYVFYPDLRLIYSSLMNRYDLFGGSTGMRSEETLEQLVEYSRITGYHLRSHMFSLEGVRIPSFTGRINLRIHGPSQLVNLVHLLFRYGEYAGVGIKTAIGMGKIQVAERRAERGRK